MTRPLLLVALALLAAAACSAPEAPEAAATPTAFPPQTMPVHILVPENPDPGVSAWAQALAEAISSGQGGLALAQTPEEAAAAVRIDAVEKGTDSDPAPEGEGEVQVMRGALLVGEKAHEFDLAYRGDPRPQAEALARNLRQFAAQVAAAGPTEGAADAGEPPEGTSGPEAGNPPERDVSPPEPADTEDDG